MFLTDAVKSWKLLFSVMENAVFLCKSKLSTGHSTVPGKLNSQSTRRFAGHLLQGVGGNVTSNFPLLNRSNKFGCLSPVSSGPLYLVPNNEILSLVFGSLFRKRCEVQ